MKLRDQLKVIGLSFTSLVVLVILLAIVSVLTTRHMQAKNGDKHEPDHNQATEQPHTDSQPPGH